MIKVHTVVLTDGSKDYPFLITGTKTSAKGTVLPLSKAEARHMAIVKLWETEFKPYVHKRIGETSVQQLSLVSEAYRWATMEEAFSVKLHKVKAIKEGDVSLSTKRNADGTKKRRRNVKTSAPAPVAPAPAPVAPAPAPKTATLPNGVVVDAA